MITQPTIFLSRRNLLALLSKLDRKVAGESTACTIIKYRDNLPGAEVVYNQTMDSVHVVAVDDEEFYTAHKRPAGIMAPADEHSLPVPSTGVVFGSLF